MLRALEQYEAAKKARNRSEKAKLIYATKGRDMRACLVRSRAIQRSSSGVFSG